VCCTVHSRGTTFWEKLGTAQLDDKHILRVGCSFVHPDIHDIYVRDHYEAHFQLMYSPYIRTLIGTG
jgi:hypothetical protein